jgi:octopine/nopaline transport system permease protein
MTLAVSLAAFAIGIALGVLGAWAKLSHLRPARAISAGYTTVFRGVPICWWCTCSISAAALR